MAADLRRPWTFRLLGPELSDAETVCVSGDCPELGSWSCRSVRPLTRNSGSNIWSATLDIPSDRDVHFRYCVCILYDDPPLVLIRSWETDLIPRVISPSVNPSDVPDIYGKRGEREKIDSGWITNETILQLKFTENPFTLTTPSGDSLRIKLTQEDHQFDSEESDSNGISKKCAVSRVATLNNHNCKFELQEKYGRIYNLGDYLVFEIANPNLQLTAYSVEFYNCTSDKTPQLIGSSYILPNLFKNTEGEIELPIISKTKQRPVGSMRAGYFVVRPMPDPPCNMMISYKSHWSESWKGLDVGHRGSGSSFKTKESTSIRENTIASLKKAAAGGADLLEFDVQLSKDLIPVVYHDFHVCIALKKKKQLEHSEMLEIPMKDLTLEQLQKLKVYHVAEGRDNEPRFFDEDLAEHQPFPELSEVLQTLDQHVGFNIEIKGSMPLEDGSLELEDQFDLNLYIDKFRQKLFTYQDIESGEISMQDLLMYGINLGYAFHAYNERDFARHPTPQHVLHLLVDKLFFQILEVVLRYGMCRRIVFSSFHPDICTMLRLKQNAYPTMFLTQGVTKRYQAYRDFRCNTISAAVNHALNAGLLGIVVHTEDLLRDPSQVKLATDAGLIIFCWGDDNNNKDTIKYLKDLGLHGVIYDKLDQFSTKKVKESIFLGEAREAQKDLLKMQNC